MDACIVIDGMNFRVNRHLPDGRYDEVVMTAADMRAQLEGVKLQYEPAKEFNPRVRDERYTLLSELQELNPPPLTADEFVHRLQNIRAGQPADLDQFEVIEFNDSTRIRSKKHYIRDTRFERLCAHHGFVSATHKAEVETAMKAAGWTKGAMQNVKCWRRE